MESPRELKKLVWGVEPVGVTKAGIILAVILTIISPIVMTLMYGLVWHVTFMEWVWAWPGLIFLLLIGVINVAFRLLFQFLRGQGLALTVGDGVLSLVAINTSAGYAISSNFLITHLVYMSYGSGASISDYGKLMPDLWVPKGNITIADTSMPVLKPLFDPDAHALLVSQPNWYMAVLGAWAPSLILWMLVFLGLALSQVGFALLFRKPWVEEEMLPFPYAQMAVEVMRTTGFKGAWEHRNWSKLWFLIGALVGFLIELPDLLSSMHVIGQLPDLYGALLVSSFGGYDLSPFIGNNVALMITLSPLFVGLAFLMPIDILVTAVSWYILMYIIIPPIEVASGFIPLQTTQSAFNNYYYVGHWVGLMPHLITRGVAIGFPIMWFFLVWRHMKNWGDKEVKWGHVLAWGGLALAWIMLAISGVEAHIALMIVIITLLLYVAWMRVRAETTWTTAIMWYGPWWHEMLALPWLPYRYSGKWHSKEAFAAAASFYPLVTDRTLATTPGPAIIEGFKLGKISGVRVKTIAIIGVLGAVLGIIIAFIGELLGFYGYGPNATGVGIWLFGADTNLEPQWLKSMIFNNKITHMSNDPNLWMPQFISGIILGIILVWIRVLFPGVPFNPLGVLIGDMPVTGVLMFIPNIIALIVKPLYIRIAGVESYERVIVPFMAGMVIFSFLTMWYAWLITT